MIRQLASTDAKWTDVHTVRDGETLRSIAKRDHTSLAEFLKHNSQQFDAAKMAAGHTYKKSLESKNERAGHRNPNDIWKGDRVVVPPRGDQARVPSRKPVASPHNRGPVADRAQKPIGADEKAARLIKLRQREQQLTGELDSNEESMRSAPDISAIVGAQIAAEGLERELTENRKEQQDLIATTKSSAK
jgi:hypothetical protein